MRKMAYGVLPLQRLQNAHAKTMLERAAARTSWRLMIERDLVFGKASVAVVTLRGFRILHALGLARATGRNWVPPRGHSQRRNGTWHLKTRKRSWDYS